MFFLQAMQSPILVTLVHAGGRTVLSIPKMTMDDIMAWMAEYKQEMMESRLKDLDEARRREFETFYGAIDPDINDAGKLIRTPKGTQYVILNRLPLATKVSGADFDYKSQQGVLSTVLANGMGRMFPLAWALADLTDNSQTDPSPLPPVTAGGEDPLTSGVKDE